MAQDNPIKRGNRRYRCDDCNFVTGWKTTLERHVETMHNTIKEFMCASCDYVYTHDYDLKQHIKRRHMDKKKNQPSGMESLGKRLRQSYSFAERASIIQDLQEYLDKNGKASYRAMEVKFGVPSSTLNKWVQNKEQIFAKAADNTQTQFKSRQWFSCEECNFTTGSSSALQRHVMEMHGTLGDIRFSNCSYRSTNAEDLRRHVKKSHKDAEKCKLCDFEPKSQEALTQHIMSDHMEHYSEPKVEKVDEWIKVDDSSPDSVPKVDLEFQDEWDEEEKYDTSLEEAPLSCFEAKEAVEKLKKFLQQSEISENVDIATMTLSDMSTFINARTAINSLKKSLNWDRKNLV